MAPRRTKRTAQTATERLGPVFHRLRTERRIPTSQLSEETGLDPSYLAHLERGRFKDMGIEKFARLVKALSVSADQVLAQMGLLPSGAAAEVPDSKAFLRARYKLSPADLQSALDFLDFLSRKSRLTKVEKEPRSRT